MLLRMIFMLTIVGAAVPSKALDLCQYSQQSVEAADSMVNITANLFSNPQCQGFHLYRMLRTTEYGIFQQLGEGALADFRAHNAYKTFSMAVVTIWTMDSVRTTPIPTNPKVTYEAVLNLYSVGFEGYYRAAMEAELIRLRASYGTAEDAVIYSRSYRVYLARANEALSAWETKGYKVQLEKMALGL